MGIQTLCGYSSHLVFFIKRICQIIKQICRAPLNTVLKHPVPLLARWLEPALGSWLRVAGRRPKGLSRSTSREPCVAIRLSYTRCFLGRRWRWCGRNRVLFRSWVTAKCASPDDSTRAHSCDASRRLPCRVRGSGQVGVLRWELAVIIGLIWRHLAPGIAQQQH